MREIHLTCRDARLASALMGIFRERLIVTSYISRTHEPCVPTCQVNFPRVSNRNLVCITDARAVRPYKSSEFPIISRQSRRRHNMTSLRSLYVSHGLLSQGAARKLACHWTMYFIPFREYPPQCIFHSAWLTTTYYLLPTTYYLLPTTSLLPKTKSTKI